MKHFLYSPRMEAKTLQLKIEETTGVRLDFNLKPGDSVFQTFDDVDVAKYCVKRRRRSFGPLGDRQLLTVSRTKQKVSDAASDGLKLVAEYLSNQIPIDEQKLGYSREEKRLQRTTSQILIKTNLQSTNSHVLSEYKEYLRALSKSLPQPRFKKILPFKRRRGNENNPIVVITQHQ